MFLYFNIRNFEIPKYFIYAISKFQNTGTIFKCENDLIE